MFIPHSHNYCQSHTYDYILYFIFIISLDFILFYFISYLHVLYYIIDVSYISEDNNGRIFLESIVYGTITYMGTIHPTLINNTRK